MNLSPTLNYSSILTSLDWIVFFAILIATFISVWIGHWLKKRTDQKYQQQAAEESIGMLELLLMGRQLTLPLFVATLVATWYGGIFGVTKIAFEQGIFNFVTQGVFWYVAYLLFAFFIVDKVKNYHAVTLPDLMNKMFGKKAAALSAIFNFFNVLPIAYVISLGLFLQLFISAPLWMCMLGGVIVVMTYTLYGGFRAIVFSDLFQFFVMCSAVLIVLIVSVITFGGPAFLMSNLPPAHFSLTGGETIATTMVWGFIALSTLVDPNFYQRVFAAKSTKVAKKGIMVSTIIWICFDICTTGGAMYARAVLPEADSGNAYLIYALQILPDGMRGFFLAGILATILSTIDSYMFIAGTTLSYDMMPKKWRGKISLHHLGVISVGFLAVLMGSIFDGNIKMVWKTLGSYSASCMLLPVVYGYIFPKRITDGQFIFSSILGIIAVTYWKNASHHGFWQNVDELYIGVMATSLGLATYHQIIKIKTFIFRGRNHVCCRDCNK